MTDLELYLKTNPVFTTAESCLLLISMTGNPDAVALRDALGLAFETNGENVPEEMKKQIFATMPGLIAGMESRFETHNNFIDASGIKNIVDLPCGFEPRGPKYARKQMHYYGFDLPAVIERVGGAAISITEPEYRNYLHYCSVDATNYESLRNALSDVKGEILITTEGMLMYFNDSELKTVCCNIAALLEEFGGCWVTFDRFSLQHTSNCMRGVLGDAALKVMGSVSGAAGKLSDIQTKNNILYAPEDQAVLQLMNEVGLTVEKVPFTKYSADLKIVKSLPEGTMDHINQLLAGVELWVMRAKKKAAHQHKVTVGAAEIQAVNTDGSMNLFLSGRLDSLNAPALLKEYEKLAELQKIQKVHIHMENLEYISSAGLRTLLIIYKNVGGNFHISGCNPSVREILQMTGFDDLFGSEE